MKTEKEIRESLPDDLPEDVWELVGGVNIFNGPLLPEERADPMICDRNIKLSKSEIAFLRLGPRFMLRQTLDELDFKTDLNKMVVKERFEDTAATEARDEDEEKERPDSSLDASLEKRA